MLETRPGRRCRLFCRRSSDRVRGRGIQSPSLTKRSIGSRRRASAGPAENKMVGLEQQLVSTPDIDQFWRHPTCRASTHTGSRFPDISFYVLGLRDIDVTLAFDATSGTWAQWTSLTAGAEVLHAVAVGRGGHGSHAQRTDTLTGPL